MVKGYILTDSEQVEHFMVIRTEDIDLLHTLVRRMSRMRDERIKTLGKMLQEDLDERNIG